MIVFLYYVYKCASLSACLSVCLTPSTFAHLHDCLCACMYACQSVGISLCVLPFCCIRVCTLLCPSFEKKEIEEMEGELTTFGGDRVFHCIHILCCY